MKEILAGGGFSSCVDELELEAVRTYQGGDIDVWVLSDEAFDKLCLVDEASWRDEYGWWRYAVGSTVESYEVHSFVINGQIIDAYLDSSMMSDIVGYLRDDYIDFDEDVPSDEDLMLEAIQSCERYGCLREYLRHMFGASTPKNLCAISVSLANLNNMSLSRLWSEYQGYNHTLLSML